MFDSRYLVSCIGAGPTFNIFKTERGDILKSAHRGEKIWEDGNSLLINKDDMCMTYHSSSKLRLTHKCVKCSVVEQFYKTVEEKILVLETPDRNGDKYTVDTYPSSRHLSDVKTNNENYENILLSSAKSCCGLDGSRIEMFYGSDKFTNMLLVNYVLSERTGLKTYKMIETGSVCGPHDKVIQENTDGPIDPENISADIVVDIFEQLVVTFFVLQSHFQFNHGNPSYKSLDILKRPSGVSYEGHEFQWATTLKLKEMQNSSITDGKTRFYNADVDTDIYLNEKSFQPKIEQGSSMYPSQGLFEWYVIQKDICHILTSHLKHMGTPFYLSFDLYAFITSLMTISQFRNVVNTNERLTKMWNSMWFPEDLVKVNKRIILPYKHEHLSNLRLRCDLGKVLFNQLKK
jgi:hypothetical protein